MLKDDLLFPEWSLGQVAPRNFAKRGQGCRPGLLTSLFAAELSLPPALALRDRLSFGGRGIALFTGPNDDAFDARLARSDFVTPPSCLAEPSTRMLASSRNKVMSSSVNFTLEVP